MPQLENFAIKVYMAVSFASFALGLHSLVRNLSISRNVQTLEPQAQQLKANTVATTHAHHHTSK